MSIEEVLVERRPLEDLRQGGRLLGTQHLDLEVVDTDYVAGHLRSLLVFSPDLFGFEYLPGQDLMVELSDGDRTVHRRYTIRRGHPGAGMVELEIDLHTGCGVAAQWAAGVEGGSHFRAIGPKGTITIQPEALSHLFVADDSAMPAAFAMLEALPRDTSATAVLVTPRGPTSRPGPNSQAKTRLLWMHEADVPDVIAGWPLKPGTAAYVNGERSLVLRTVDLLLDAGLNRYQLAAKAYWRRDQPNAPHGEPLPN